MAPLVVRGMKALTAKIKRIEKNVKKHVSAPMVRAAGKETAKVIKNNMSPKYKDARKSIGWSMRKAKDNKKGTVSAKAGAGVGWKGKRKRKFLEEQRKRREIEQRPGVGISPQNIHWWFLGTKKRRLSDGRPTGTMPIMERPVSQLAAQGKASIFRAKRMAAIIGFKRLVKS